MLLLLLLLGVCDSCVLGGVLELGLLPLVLVLGSVHLLVLVLRLLLELLLQLLLNLLLVMTVMLLVARLRLAVRRR